MEMISTNVAANLKRLFTIANELTELNAEIKDLQKQVKELIADSKVLEANNFEAVGMYADESEPKTQNVAISENMRLLFEKALEVIEVRRNIHDLQATKRDLTDEKRLLETKNFQEYGLDFKDTRTGKGRKKQLTIYDIVGVKN